MASATAVYEGKPGDMYIAASRDHTPGYERDFVNRTIAFWNDELYLRNKDGSLAKVDAPSSAQKGIHKDWLLLELRDPYTAGHQSRVADLAAGLVRFIGAPLERIAEDHLRILRFFRFSARFAKGALDPASLDACRIRANDLMALSRERIAMELLALLALPDPAAVVALMIDNGIFKPVLPEIRDATPLAHLISREAAEAADPDPIRRLCALIPADPALAEDVANRLKLSNAQRKRMVVVAQRSAADADAPRALAYWLGREVAVDRLLLGTSPIAPLTGWDVPRFPITGGAIVARGVQAGPEVARILQSAERQWVAEGFPDAQRAAAILDKLLAG